MRYLFGVLVVCALGVVPLLGCSETTGDGGNGGSAGTGGTGGSTGQVFACNEQGIRDAIAEGGGPHTFDCNGATTVVTQAPIEIDKDVILNGAGEVTVDGNDDHHVFSVAEGVTAELRGFTVTNGVDDPNISGAGGIRISAKATVTLTNTTVSGNQGGWGGGISSGGTLNLVNSTVSDNIGSGIVSGGALTLTDSVVSGNVSTNLASGGGIVAVGDMTLIVDSTVSGNSSLDGGGINACLPLAGGCSPLTLIDSTVSGNTASGGGGGIYGGEPLTLTNSTVSGNSAEYGAGIFAAGDMFLITSTVSDNTATTDGGGIIQAQPGAATSVFNSTVSGNSASNSQGDGIWHTWEGAITLLNSTVVNSIHVPDGLELLEIAGTLVAGACTQDGPPGPGPSSSGYNIESPGNTCGFDQGTDQPSVPDPMLGPLADNGGPTETHALEEGSPAINQIPAADCVDEEGEPLTTDQRGLARPQGDSCDVGAFELEVLP